MKNNYEARALKFAETVLAPLFQDCYTLTDYLVQIDCYNWNHKKPLRYDHGVTRITILRNDYVIKFDIIPIGRFSDGSAGDCESEVEIYNRAVEDGFSHLLAKPSLHYWGSKPFLIQPLVKGVGRTDYWWRYCSEEEEYWLDHNVYDLHSHNYGFRKGKLCIFDYAWGSRQQSAKALYFFIERHVGECFFSPT